MTTSQYQRTAAAQIHRLLFFAGIHRALPGQCAPSEGNAGVQYPSRCLARIPTLESLHFARHAPASGGSAPGARADHGLDRLRGKSSPLAALIDGMNTLRRDHIVTIEDPVEFVHSNRNSIVEQIEVGHDAPNLPAPSASIMRQTPDVHPGRRDAGPGNDCHRADRRRDRAPGAFDAAHE